MLKKLNLKSFNLFEYLKEQQRQYMSVPYLLADKHTYKDARVRFPFRTFTYGIGLTYTGIPELFKIGSTDYAVGAGCLTTIGPGIVSHWMGDYTADHDTIYFTEELFANSLRASFLKSLPFFMPGGNHVIPLDEQAVAEMGTLFRTIKTFNGDQDIITGLVYALLVLVKKYHNLQGQHMPAEGSHQGQVAATFRQLLAKHFATQKDVGFYAAHLHISPKYLSEVLQAQLGKPAKMLIDEYIAMEAKSLLRQTTMSVQEIAYTLGYEDGSYFIKAFKKWEGLTPAAYKKL
ncbi:helix-turn-helix domain-containing protein [Taibaiella chishuiensis]|uniref:AraC-like DNA-binding protein n=1 Tax=Taibaiella chishuiensis TaxID=1434707 RepID=A0A2P8CY18_9BACT|nr:helix-turn-helix domain-containing protein [Taibaiella chishuiensis]PSK89816.1 AraC-like DNA-binding protein [Taibaiella chishuiensis]